MYEDRLRLAEQKALMVHDRAQKMVAEAKAETEVTKAMYEDQLRLAEQKVVAAQKRATEATEAHTRWHQGTDWGRVGIGRV